MRLQRLLARAGVASRRESEEFIAAGRVSVNGEVVDTIGSKADPAVDLVCVDGVELRFPDETVTLMLNKPAGYVTTMDDPQGRPCVASLVPVDRFPGLFPLGRLDRDTTGLLLFSTDGELGHGLLRPRGEVEKCYLALVEGRPSKESLERLRIGVVLDDGPTLPASVELLEGESVAFALASMGLGEKDSSGARLRSVAAKSGKSSQSAKPTQSATSAQSVAPVQSVQSARNTVPKGSSLIRVGIHEGRKREVRRMFEAVGHKVLALHRESFAGLELGGLERGTWRLLDEDEIARLRELV